MLGLMDWKRLKKVFQPAFGSAQHQKAGRNTQHMFEPGTHNGIFLIHLELLYRAWFYFCTDENKRKSKLDLTR